MGFYNQAVIKALIFLLLWIGILRGVWSMFASNSKLTPLEFLSRGKEEPIFQPKSNGREASIGGSARTTCILGPVPLASETWRKMMGPVRALGFPLQAGCEDWLTEDWKKGMAYLW